MPDDPNPSVESSERRAMQADWELITDVLAGPRVIREKKDKYLPQYEDETNPEYERRLKTTPWRPEFADALRNLASKPFDQDVSFKESDGVSKSVKDLSENVDGRGNNMTRFSAETFEKGVAKGLHFILVDYPTMAKAEAEIKPVTLADEKRAGARPVWVQIEALDVIAFYTRWENGKEVVDHFRYRETVTVRDGFDEKQLNRVRVYEPGKWEVWEENPDNKKWRMISDGVIRRGRAAIESVPVVRFRTGEALGELRVKPPLSDLADMQIELYQALSRKDEIMTYAGSPMLAAEGMGQPTFRNAAGKEELIKISVGPKRVLFSPPSRDGVNTTWKWIQPDAGNIKEVREDVQSIVTDMRRLGLQPLTPQSGNPTATGQSIEAAKAHSACENWASALKDALELAWIYTCEWINETKFPECVVNTDFDVLPFAQAPLDALASARGTKDLSQRTYWDGLKRFDVLPQDFDPELEEQLIAEETAALEPEEGIDPVTGAPIDDQGVDPTTIRNPTDITDEQLRALYGDDIMNEAGL